MSKFLYASNFKLRQPKRPILPNAKVEIPMQLYFIRSEGAIQARVRSYLGFDPSCEVTAYQACNLPQSELLYVVSSIGLVRDIEKAVSSGIHVTSRNFHADKVGK